MTVSIDTVYQRVLTLASKEQRGYITPQEFNLLANHAQMEIFEQYFYDVKQFNRIPGNTTEYSDMLNILHEKIGLFEEEEDNAWMITNMPTLPAPLQSYMQIPSEVYKIGTVRIGDNQVELMNTKDFDAAMISPLTAPTSSRPIGTLTSKGLRVAVAKDEFATPGDFTMNISYIARPAEVQWAYVVVNDKPLYNPNIAVDFELHQSEETELVYKILKLAGVNLKSPEMIQIGQTLEQTQNQLEKQ